MRPADNVNELIKKLQLKASADLDKRVHDDISRALTKSEKTKSAQTEPNIWRIIMKSRTSKLAAAAVIVIAVLIGINHFSDSTSVVWADVVEKVKNIETYAYRMRGIETTGPMKESFEFTTEKETMVYRSGRYGERTETYTNGELSTQSYTNLEKNEFVGVIPLAKEYECEPLTEERIQKFHNGHPKRIVMRVLQDNYVELGRDKIDGKDVQGVEIYDPAVFNETPPPMEDFVARLWIDTQTELPVWVEISFVEEGSSLQSTTVVDQFQWGVELGPVDFEPNIPSDYKLVQYDAPVHAEPTAGVGQRESFFAENTVSEPYLSDFEDAQLPDLEQLALLGVIDDARKPNVRLVGHIEIWKTQDEFIREWPVYEDIRGQLYQELLEKLNIEQLSVEELAATGIALRKKFWELGGCLSKTSYAYGYASRIVLELAHEEEPTNMAITDQLVESILCFELMYSYKENSEERIWNTSYHGVLTELRDKQFEQIKQDVEGGHIPTWKDFARVSDLALLLGCTGDYAQAREITQWLILHANNGGWTTYVENLRKMDELYANDQRCGIMIFVPRLHSFPEEYRYARRLPSFQGPDSRNHRLVPLHMRGSNRLRRATSD